MKKFMSLLKATMAGNMNLFRTKKTESKRSQIIVSLFLTIVVMVSVASYAFMMADVLKPLNLTYVMLSLAIILITIITFMEGLYKAQGILFDSKDNDLLFSLPITKKYIIFSRILKLLVFQSMYSFLFIVPFVAVYGIYEHPGAIFYLLSLIMIILLPIIPTVIACILGYFIKQISNKSKFRNAMQTTLTLVFVIGIMYLSFNLNSLIASIAQNATSINDIITKLYYPAGLYINLIQRFDIWSLIQLIGINIIILVLFVYIFSISYFKIISKASEKKSTIQNKKNIESLNLYKVKTPIKALIIKDFKKYITTPVYIYNTIFGVILIFIMAIAMSVNLDGTLNAVINSKSSNSGLDMEFVKSILPSIYLQALIVILFMTSITSCSISIERKSFEISKTLPISINKILLSKILMSDMIIIPLVLIANLIFFIAFKIAIIDMILITLTSIILPHLVAIVGLIINLKYPKLDVTSDTEIVKQSMSTVVATLGGMIIGIALGIIVIALGNKMDVNIIKTIEVILFFILTFISTKLLYWYGNKRFLKIDL